MQCEISLMAAISEVQLYLIILEELGKHEEALALLQGDLGSKARQRKLYISSTIQFSEKLVTELNFQQLKIAEQLTKLTRWEEVNLVYRKLLLNW